jgi:serine/threonine protein kinase
LDKGVIKLTDFGCSKVLKFDGSVSESQHTAVGTMQFMAPEVVKSDDGGMMGDSEGSLDRLNAVHDEGMEGTGDGGGIGGDDGGIGGAGGSGNAGGSKVPAPKGYGRKADVWSLGMTVIEMGTGAPPWPNAANAIYKLCMTEDIPPFPEALSAEGQDFLTRCLQRDPANRSDMSEMLEPVHPFLQPSDDPKLMKTSRSHHGGNDDDSHSFNQSDDSFMGGGTGAGSGDSFGAGGVLGTMDLDMASTLGSDYGGGGGGSLSSDDGRLNSTTTSMQLPTWAASPENSKPPVRPFWEDDVDTGPGGGS